MSRLAHARPEDLLRAGALLGATADELGTAVARCRLSADVDWVGLPGERYQERLTDVADGLALTRAAFDTACDALLAYGRALSRAQELAREADALFAVPDPTPGLEDRAACTRALAEQEEALAAGRLAQVLHDLADRAPRVGAATLLSHGIASFAKGVGQGVTGGLALVGTAARALPLVGSSRSRQDARDELLDEAKATLQPWKQLDDLWQALREGQAWQTAGQAAGSLLLWRRKPDFDRTLYGGHDGLPAPVMLAIRGEDPRTALDAYALHRMQQDLVDELRRLQHVRLPEIGDLLRDGVNLLHQEAHGGHTLLKHVGRDQEFLEFRHLVDVRRDGTPHETSSFTDLGEAQRLVHETLLSDWENVMDWVQDGFTPTAEVVMPLPAPVGTVIGIDGLLADATAVVVRLARTRDGGVVIRTAMLAP